MSRQIWSQLLGVMGASGSTFASFTTAKTVINQEGLVYIGGNSLKVGDMIRVAVRGALSTLVTTPGTVTFQVMFGSVIVWTSGAIQLNATAHTTLPFTLDVDLVVQVINTAVGGAVAKLLGIGKLQGVMFTKTAGQTDGANTESSIIVPVTAPAQGTAFDSTIAQTMDFWVGFSISNAANLVQIHQYRVESFN